VFRALQAVLTTIRVLPQITKNILG